ncbi:MAG: FUSC family protein, partial [Solirubrobacteraceae bacterium]
SVVAGAGGARAPARPLATRADVQRMRERIAATLRVLAAAIQGDALAEGALADATARSFDLHPPTSELDLLPPPLRRRSAAIAGQLRAMTRLCEQARPGRLLDRRPRSGGLRLRERIRSDLALMRANATFASPAGRHAVRLAVVVLLSGLLARIVPLERSYWIVVAAATALRPDFAATFTRGVERVLGTVAGVGLASAIALALHPNLLAVTPILAILGLLAFAVFPASFAAGFAFVTALIVFLLDAVSPHTLTTAGDRLIDTLIGGALGLLAYAAWPTWSGGSARQTLAEAIDAERDYLRATVRVLIDGRRAERDRPSEIAEVARRARRAYASAEEAIARALAEPSSHRAGAERSRSALLALRRVAGVVHLLRAEGEATRPHPAPRATLTPLTEALDARLHAIDVALASHVDGATPSGPTAEQLRERYGDVKRALTGTETSDALLDQLDELVDAVNTLAVVVAE